MAFEAVQSILVFCALLFESRVFPRTFWKHCKLSNDSAWCKVYQ